MGDIKEMMEAGKVQLFREAKIQLAMLLTISVLGILVVEPIQRLYDLYVRDRPFVTASVEIQRSLDGEIRILYAARATTDVRVNWSAWVDVEGRRTCGGHGVSGHGPESLARKPKPWDWADWLQAQCPVPIVPFSVCVRYVAITASGVGDTTAPYCSETFDPTKE